jgi:YD repeat-containing protein
MEAASKAIDDLLDGRTKELPKSVRSVADRCLHQVAHRRVSLPGDSVRWPGTLRVEGAARLLAMDVVEMLRDADFTIKPRRPTNLRSVYEQNQLERLHGDFLADHVFPGSLKATFQVNFVDQRLTTPRDWRDVYRYDEAGRLVGWTRFDGKDRHEFTAAGDRIVEKDNVGRALKVCSVRYVQDPVKERFRVNTNPLRQVDGPVRLAD